MAKNQTKKKILEAALKIFTQKGFAASSISQIAGMAQINQSLIYHHFKSKVDLWVLVKQYCIDKVLKDLKPIRYDSIDNFINDLTDNRFFVYSSPLMRMLAHWQALEVDTFIFYEKSGIDPHPMFDISNHIKILQENGLISNTQDAQLLSGIIFALSSYAFFDFAHAYNLSSDQHNNYKELARKTLIQILKQ